MRTGIIMRLLAWNVNGIRSNERELFHLITELKTDLITLCETRADAKPTLDKIWPWSKVLEVFPVTSPTAIRRAGLAMVGRPGGKALLEGR